MIRRLYIVLLLAVLISAQHGRARQRLGSSRRYHQKTIDRHKNNCTTCNYKIPDDAVHELSRSLADIIKDFVRKHCNNKNCRAEKLEQVFEQPVENLDGSRRFGSSEEGTTTEAPKPEVITRALPRKLRKEITTPACTTISKRKSVRRKYPKVSRRRQAKTTTTTTTEPYEETFEEDISSSESDSFEEETSAPHTEDLHVRTVTEEISTEHEFSTTEETKEETTSPATTTTMMTTTTTTAFEYRAEEPEETTFFPEMTYAETTPSPTTTTETYIESTLAPTTTESIDKQNVEKMWTEEYKSTVYPSSPKIEELHNKYKNGIKYLKENPNATSEELTGHLMKNPEDLYHYQDIIPMLKDVAENEDRLNSEFRKISNSNDNILKYKTAIAFLKIRQKGNRERNKFLLDALEKRGKILKEEEMDLRDKLILLNEEYNQLQSDYGKIVKEAERDKDKVVVAVMKFPIKKENENFTKEQMNRAIDIVKEKYTENYEIVAPETIKVVKDTYIFTDDDKEDILSNARYGLQTLRSGIHDRKFSIERGYYTLEHIFSLLPEKFLKQEDKMFKLNPYQDSENLSTQLNPTLSLQTLQNNIRQLVTKKLNGAIQNSRQEILTSIMRVLSLLIDRVENNSSKPHVSVYSMAKKP